MCEYVYYFFIALNVSKSLEKLLRALLQEANLGSDVLFVVSSLQLCNCTGYGALTACVYMSTHLTAETNGN